MRIENLGLVTDSVRKLLRTQSATKPKVSIPKPGQEVGSENNLPNQNVSLSAEPCTVEPAYKANQLVCSIFGCPQS